MLRRGGMGTTGGMRAWCTVGSEGGKYLVWLVCWYQLVLGAAGYEQEKSSRRQSGDLMLS